MRAADPGGFLDATLALPSQLRVGHASGRGASGLPSGDGVDSIVLSGMGGSAISGDVIRTLFRDRLVVPFDVVRGPDLPEYCGKDTLVFCSSYSGNTAETLKVFDEAARRGCRIVAVTSGGRLLREAERLEVPVIPVPPGFMPRAAFGYLLMGAVGALEAMGLAPELEEELDESVAALNELAEDLGPTRETDRNPAKALAAALHGRFPVIWAAEGLGAAAAARWKTQLNENAKVPAFWSAVPELDHNEVVGWSDDLGAPFHIVALRHAGEHPEVASRFPVSLSIAASAGALHEEVWATGESDLARVLSLILRGDLASVYLAFIRGIDPSPVAAIDRVKRELAGT
jgi:glucose/mannose-6-phosphate isomerase